MEPSVSGGISGHGSKKGVHNQTVALDPMRDRVADPAVTGRAAKDEQRRKGKRNLKKEGEKLFFSCPNHRK